MVPTTTTLTQPYRAGRREEPRCPARLPSLLRPLLLALLLGLSPAAALGADGSARNAMADAMARMMDALGFLDDNQGGSGSMIPGMGQFGMDPSSWSRLASPGFGTNPFGINPFLPGQIDWGQLTQQPWMSGMADSARAFGMDRMLPQIPGMPGWQRTTLEGLWEGRGGGLLIVQNHRFRLYGPDGGYIEGLIQQRGERVALYDPANDFARPYELAQHQGRLVLRDASGQVYLYRRLWLEDLGLPGGASGAGR